MTGDRPPGWYRGEHGQPVSRWPSEYHGAGRPWPAVRPVPKMPDLAAGHCATGAAGLPPQAWAGPVEGAVLTAAEQADDDELKQAAVYACGSCPVRDACRAWALSLPESKSSRQITAGLTGRQLRNRRKRGG